jgi:hypothetical protein
MKTLGIAVVILPLLLTGAEAAVSCATLGSIAACVKCGAQYDRATQEAYCRANWKPGQKVRTWTKEDERRVNGAPGINNGRIDRRSMRDYMN